MAAINPTGGSTVQAVAAGSTPILLTCFNTAAGANGLSNDCTSVKARNKITVTRAGTYLINYSISYTSSVNTVWEFYAFNDGTVLSGTGAMSKIAVGTDTQCVSGNGYAAVAAGNRGAGNATSSMTTVSPERFVAPAMG